MKTAYYSAFYQLLRFTFWVRTQDTQEWTALYCLSFLLFLNVATLYAVTVHYYFPYGHTVSVIGAVFVFILIVFFNYRVLRHNAVFQNPATIQQERTPASATWLVGVYVVLSFILGAYFIKQLHDVNVAFRY